MNAFYPTVQCVYTKQKIYNHENLLTNLTKKKKHFYIINKMRV